MFDDDGVLSHVQANIRFSESRREHFSLVARGRGGIGRHAGFRCRWRKPWGFESLRPHRRRRIGPVERPRDLRGPRRRIAPVGRTDPGCAEAGDDAPGWTARGGNVAAVPVLPDIAGRERAGRRRALTRRRQLGEAALVRAAQRGSDEAVEELFSRHWGAAYRAALLVTGDRAAAEDIAQEAFLAALRALPRFDLHRPLRPWLHRIVVTRAIDWSRARAHRQEVGADAAPEAAGGDAADPRALRED